MIYWYEKDERFVPGTVADHDYIRIILRQVFRNRQPIDRWRVYIKIRTYKIDGVEDTLKSEVKVAEFKKCETLKEAQKRAEKWFDKFKKGIKY